MVGNTVILRSPSIRDQQHFVSLVRLSAGFLSKWVSPAVRSDQFLAYLRRCRRSDYAGLVACRRSDGTLLGSINFSQIVRGVFQSAYLNYWVGAPFSRKGYMTEALSLALRYAFRSLKLHRVEASIQPENTASLRLVRRLGFSREGYSRRYLMIHRRWRDHERWALLAEEWHANATRSRH